MNKKTKPIFIQVAEDLKKKIDEGFYGTAQKLPSEYDLADEYEVSRLTVRKAINLLINQNILIKQSGKGTYVMKAPEHKKGCVQLMGFSEAATFYGQEPSAKLISVEELEEVPPKILDALELKKNDKILQIVRLRALNQEPMTVENLYMQRKYLKDTSVNILENSIFKQIEEKIEIAYSHQEVEATLVTEELAKLLEVEVNDPLLKSTAVMYSATGKPILYDQSFYRADQYSFKKTLQRYRE